MNLRLNKGGTYIDSYRDSGMQLHFDRAATLSAKLSHYNNCIARLNGLIDLYRCNMVKHEIPWWLADFASLKHADGCLLKGAELRLTTMLEF